MSSPTLVGSTELASRLGHDAYEALRHEHFTALRGAVTKHNGSEVKTTGDGLMLRFDSAASAIACAIAMQQATNGAGGRRVNGLDQPLNWSWPGYMTSLSEAVSDLNDRAAAAVLDQRLRPVASQVYVMAGMVGCSGSYGLWAGKLAACLQHWDDAERHFADALAMNERLGARPYVVRTRRAWALMLLDRNDPSRTDDAARARDLIAAGRAEAEQLGMARELGRRAAAGAHGLTHVMNPRKLLRRLADGNLQNVSFADIPELAEGFGFRVSRISGSHHIFIHATVSELVNLQEGARRSEAVSDSAVVAPRRTL